MTALFWMALTWVLCATAVGRLPVSQRILPGAVLLMAVPILLMILFQVGFLAMVLALVAIFSMFPNPVRLVRAYYKGERFVIDANVLRYMVVPGEL